MNLALAMLAYLQRLAFQQGVLLFATCFASAAFAAPPEYKIGPAPEWVERVAPEEGVPAPAQVSNGIYFLLSDTQTRVEAQNQTHYRHFATKALTVNGVESIAHVEIRFDPSYQTLTLNTVQVRRGGQVISKLETASVRILQREKDLELRIYDGSKTANIFLDDVRVGDVVEYAYTLRGANPVFDGRVYGGLELQWGVPIRRVYGRLLWPAGREIYFAYRHTPPKPAVSERNGYREYLWQARSVPALVIEGDAPSWYDPYPSVRWSESKDWQSVARWAQPLYQAPDQLSPALQSEIDRIAQASRDPQERLLAVLLFVQREIRYLGVEIGAGSHAPTHPSLVLERRFGDCKDKSLMMIAMLNALGIQARPALVNTALGQGVREFHPTPLAFNHVLVRAQVGDRAYWVDPTRLPQKGVIANLFQPNYDYALVVDATTRDLTRMPQAIVSKRTVRAVMDARNGIDKPVRYSLTSTFQGGSAEAQRNALAAANHEELQKTYLNFYARYYPKITAETPFTVSEDERANRVTVVERYIISDFSKHAPERKRREAEIYAPDIEGFLARPRESVRSAPLRLAHPIDFTQTTEVLLPEKWSIEPEHTTVDDPAFTFERRIKYEANDRRLILTDRYQSRLDHVPPADVARYVANLGRAGAAINLSLYRPDTLQPAPLSAMERFNWPLAMIAMLVSIFWIWLATKLYRYDPPPSATPIDASVQGIRGWLILPAIGVVVLPFRVVADFVGTVPSYAVDTWAAVTTIGNAAYHPLWAPLLLFELTANLALMVFSVLLAILFFQKRRVVPTLYIAVAASSAIVQITDLLLAGAIPAAATEVTTKDWNTLSRNVVAVALWGAYFLVSKRVKSTFVNEYRKPAAKAVAPVSVG